MRPVLWDKNQAPLPRNRNRLNRILNAYETARRDPPAPNPTPLPPPPLQSYNPTNLVNSNVPNVLNNNDRILVLPNCNALQRCSRWITALNNVKTIGCGINALAFLQEIDDPNTAKGLTEARQNSGTPFAHVVAWFDTKVKSIAPNYSVKETQYDIQTIIQMQGFFNSLSTEMPENSCTIVKYNRSSFFALQHGLTQGHYVVISKEGGKIFTYEPLTSTIEHCDRRELKRGTVSENFFKVMSDQGYISASIAVVYYSGTGAAGAGKLKNAKTYKKIGKKLFHLLDMFVDKNTPCKKMNTRRGRKKKRKGTHKKH